MTTLDLNPEDSKDFGEGISKPFYVALEVFEILFGFLPAALVLGAFLGLGR